MGYETLHPTIKASTRVKEIIKSHGANTQTATKEQTTEVGKALFVYLKGLSEINIPTDGTETPEMRKLTAAVYDDLGEVLNNIFPETEDFEGTQLFTAMPELCPIIVVFGQTVIRLPGSKDALKIKWITKNIQSQTDATEYVEMGGMIIMGVNPELDLRHPGLIDNLRNHRVTIDQVLEHIEQGIERKS